MKEITDKKSINKIKQKNKKPSEKTVKKEKTKKDKTNTIFGIVYAVLILTFLITAIVDANVPYSKTNEFVFTILIFAIAELFLFLMFTQNMLIHKNKKKRLLSWFGFVANAVILTLILVCGGDVMLFVAFVYNTIFGIYLAIDFALYKTNHPTVKFFDKKLSIVVFFALFLPMINAISHSYVDYNIILLYALIPMAVIMTIFSILSFTIFKKTYVLFAKKVWTKIGVALLAIMISFCYGMAFIDITNTSFNNRPQKIECVIVDKNVTGTGYRQITQYNLYVMINDKKVAIDVSLDLYKSKEIDDTLIVHYYKGNLNLPYYESGETL